jgi:NADH-quinone oxidoreductase subunit J
VNLLAAGTATVSSGETFAFWIFGTLAVLGALGMVLSRRAVHSALWIAMTMVSLAILYFMNAAPFLGMVQIIVYTGAVMMLFLFVLMLVGIDASDSLVETIKGQRLAAILAGIGFTVLLLSAIGDLTIDSIVGLDAVTTDAGGNVPAIGREVFGRYVLAFEVTSALLITAAVGAMVFAHRERLVRKPTQREMSEARVASDTILATPLPPSGVFAGHNAVDTPALLPDGSPAAASVPAALRAEGLARSFTTADGRVVSAADGGMLVDSADGDPLIDPVDESDGEGRA